MGVPRTAPKDDRMSRADVCETTLERLQRLYAPIRAELDEVEQILREQSRSDHPFVDQLVQHSFRLGGKRLRPALCLLACESISGRSAPALPAAPRRTSSSLYSFGVR